ncbi:MAG: hypothetical protein LBR97_01725 [Dysgonamonadaceae bacterium]|jgi:hypothetical protein|nr:hypothetical protein [Dysgonamonadaceae bacterium]
MLDIITLKNKAKWNEIIRSMNGFDFYHLAEYHRMDDSGIPLLLHYSDETADFALPFILRHIDGTKYNDITSVYGYSGPLTNTNRPDRKSLTTFHTDLLRFFDENSVVSVFFRLHPLFPVQEKILEGIGNTLDTGFTVAIDLSLPENEQRKQYSHSLKNTVNRLKRKNLMVKKAETKAEIEAFVNIYTETMKRVHASQAYFFDNTYFSCFLETLPSILYVAYYEDKIISGSLFTDCNEIIQPHLSATLDDYLYLSPLKYVWDRIRLYGVEKNRNYMHLGGGFGGNRDTLFEFKAQFSHLHFQFKTWRYVHNREIYDRLVYDKYRNDLPDSSFFPLYRL